MYIANRNKTGRHKNSYLWFLCKAKKTKKLAKILKRKIDIKSLSTDNIILLYNIILYYIIVIIQ